MYIYLKIMWISISFKTFYLNKKELKQFKKK